MFNHYNFKDTEIVFSSPRSGLLKVKKTNDELSLDFPVDVFTKVENPKELIAGLKCVPVETYKGKTDYMAVFNTQEDVVKIVPDLNAISLLNSRGLIVTAPGVASDFVSRFFAPQSGINEDPVCGSAHTTLTPYWSKKLNKKTLKAIQVSHRKGYLTCTDNGDRIIISGKAKTYLIGDIEIN